MSHHFLLQVYIYSRAVPTPMFSHKFGMLDEVTGTISTNEQNQFVSSVAWRPNSQTLLAANSTGSVKILDMAE